MKYKRAPFYLTPKELCDYLKISRTTFERMKRRGELPLFKLGGRWRISNIALEAWMTEAYKKRNPSRRPNASRPVRSIAG